MANASIASSVSTLPALSSTSTVTTTSQHVSQNLLRVFNDQAAAECVGFAADGTLLVLLDLVGHKTACRSLWATVVGGSRRPFGISGGHTVTGGEAQLDRYQAFWAELPEHNAHNLVICHERFFLATTDPKHVRPFYLAMNVGAQNEGTQNESDDMPVALADRFVAMLNQAHDLPVLPQWAGTLWRAGLRSGLIEPITARGDIAAAFRVQSDGEPWGEIIRDAFETGDIAIPDDVPAAHSQEPKSASI
jgi:hypothetical protein